MPVKSKSSNKWYNFKKIWLDPKFYNLHKDETNLKNITKLTK